MTAPGDVTERRPHVVVINDDPVQLRSTGAALESDGYRVTPYESAGLALRDLRAGEEVALFVVDLHMPDIDGWKVCRLLRSPGYADYGETPILVVSAIFSGSEVESITEELGRSAFLEMPFRRSELLSFAQALLAGETPRMEDAALVLEDDPSVRRVAARALRRGGYEVYEAETVDRARAALRDHRVKVLVLDYHLPDGSSESLLREVCGARESRVTLVMTGDDDPELHLHLLEMGIDGFVRKPFDPQVLVELAGRAARQRALLRVDATLASRTRALHRSEHRYRALVETLPDALLVLDAQDRVVRVNPAGSRRLGLDPAQMSGRHVGDLAPPGVRQEVIQAVASLRSGGERSVQTSLAERGGGSFDVELTGRPLDVEGTGELLLVARDITERRRAEEERRRFEQRVQHAQRLESLGVLASGVAHDFNNLLVGILGNAALARMDLPEGTPGTEFLEQIEMAARSATDLTEQILTFAGKRKIRNRSLDLVTLVREMEQVLRPAVSRKARVRYELPEELPGIEGDRGQLRQVVMNLIINASDSLEGEPGTIEISAGFTHLEGDAAEDLVGGQTLPDGGYVWLRVQDTGCGMSRKTIQRIFEPFFTTKNDGRGLGLAATLGIARAHGGGIRVDSETGAGTTMTVFLPAAGHQADDPQGDEATTEPWTRGGRVLVVDDEALVRRLASATLRRHGFDTEEASNGREALDRVEELGRGLGLVLLDVTMPEIDGLEVLSRLRAEPATASLPVVVSSGYSADTIPTPRPDEPTAFLAKPYRPSELMEVVSRLLEDHGPGSA